jgi:hypothetical protein
MQSLVALGLHNGVKGRSFLKSKERGYEKGDGYENTAG